MRKIIVSLALLASPAAFAQAIEHCPQPSSIVERHGVHVAPARSSGHEWIGIAAPGNGGAVLRFDEGVFYPDEASASQGEVAHCSYKLERGHLDMAYQGEAGRPKVALVDTNAWVREAGPFGIVYYACTGKNAAECTFRKIF
ncbi:MAG TPA: DUF3757 domain-containing protein [Luteibacter sp.]|nr:DUF3757 domain-containing protein [Luteibacter sp.]